MAHHMMVTLSDQEYEKLMSKATRNGTDPEGVLHEMIDRLQVTTEESQPLTEREFAEKLYREGKLTTLATPYTLTEQDKAERARLSQLFASNTLASDMVIEDRGPY